MTQRSNPYSDIPHGLGTQRFPKGFVNIKADKGAHIYRRSVWRMWNSYLRDGDPSSETMLFYYLFTMAEFFGTGHLDLFSEKLWIEQLPDEFENGST